MQTILFISENKQHFLNRLRLHHEANLAKSLHLDFQILLCIQPSRRRNPLCRRHVAESPEINNVILLYYNTEYMHRGRQIMGRCLISIIQKDQNSTLHKIAVDYVRKIRPQNNFGYNRPSGASGRIREITNFRTRLSEFSPTNLETIAYK